MLDLGVVTDLDGILARAASGVTAHVDGSTSMPTLPETR